MIHVKNLSYNIGPKRLLHDISFQLHPGDFLGIIGPNGAGKSTLLKLLCKELAAKPGCIYYHQRDVAAYSYKELSKVRSVLAQTNTVSINLSVEQLITMGRYPYFKSTPSAHDLHIIERVIKMMGVKKLKDRTYYSLSGGEQQRVQLARVLAQIYDQPESILFLDEPTNGLDIQYQQIILETAKQLTEMKFSVICILHDINYASRYANKIMILKNGECVKYGTPSEVITEEIIRHTYATNVKILRDDTIPYPIVIPVTT